MKGDKVAKYSVVLLTEGILMSGGLWTTEARADTVLPNKHIVLNAATGDSDWRSQKAKGSELDQRLQMTLIQLCALKTFIILLRAGIV